MSHCPCTSHIATHGQVLQPNGRDPQEGQSALKDQVYATGRAGPEGQQLGGKAGNRNRKQRIGNETINICTWLQTVHTCVRTASIHGTAPLD